MKRCIFLITVLFAFLSVSMAQEGDERSNQAFNFIYIVHDISTPVEELIKVLYDIESRTLEHDQRCMVCLSNGIGTKPGEEYLVATILEGSDYEPAFEKIIQELRNELAHDINIERDVNYIVNLFDKGSDFLDENGELTYESVTFDFYLSSQFCDDSWASKFIVPLYIAFDVPNMPNQFHFNVWVGAKHIKGYDISPERIFGEKNYNNINKELTITKY